MTLFFSKRALSHVASAMAMAAPLLLAVGVASADGPCGPYGDQCVDEAPVVQSDGYVYDWDGSSLSRARPVAGRRGVDARDRRVYEYAYTPACRDNVAPDEAGVFPSDASCSNAVSGPMCPPAQFAMWTYRRLVGPPAALARALAADPGAGGWRRRPVTCIGAQRRWSLAELTAIARQYLAERVSRPEALLEPPNGGITRLPVIAHTPPAGPVGFAVTRPVPGRLSATPAYRWDFGEGPTREGPGRAYDGTSPTGNPDYYVAYPYTSTGTKRVSLRMTWTATFAVAGLRIPLEDITFTDTATIDIRQARSILVDGG